MSVLTDRTQGAWRTRGHLTVHRHFLSQGTRGVPQEGTALREFRLAHPVGQEAEVAQPLEAVRWDVEHQPPQKFHGIERQGAQTVAPLIILVAERHLAVLQGHEPVIGDGDAMRVAGQVSEDVLGILEGLFRVHDPLLGAQGGEEPLPRGGLGELPTAPRQGELALCVALRQAGEVETPEAPCKDPDGQEEAGTTRHPPCPIRRYPPGRQDTMEMGMVTTTVTIP
jgi:hypothetical protein